LNEKKKQNKKKEGVELIVGSRGWVFGADVKSRISPVKGVPPKGRREYMKVEVGGRNLG